MRCVSGITVAPIICVWVRVLVIMTVRLVIDFGAYLTIDFPDIPSFEKVTDICAMGII